MPKLYRITGDRYEAAQRQEVRVEIVVLASRFPLDGNKEQVISHMVSTRFNDSWYAPEGGWSEKQLIENPPWIKATWLGTTDTDKPALWLKMMEDHTNVRVDCAVVKAPVVLMATTPAVFVDEGDPVDALIDYLTANPQRLRAILRHTPIQPFSEKKNALRAERVIPTIGSETVPLTEARKRLPPLVRGNNLRELAQSVAGIKDLEPVQQVQVQTFIETFVVVTGQGLTTEQLNKAVAHIKKTTPVPVPEPIPAPADNPAVKATLDRFSDILGANQRTRFQTQPAAEPNEPQSPQLPHEMEFLNAVRTALGKIVDSMDGHTKVRTIRQETTDLVEALDSDVLIRLRALTKFDTATVPPHQGAGISMLYHKLSLVETLLRQGSTMDRAYGLALLEKTRFDFERFLRDEPRPPAPMSMAELEVFSKLAELVHYGTVMLASLKASQLVPTGITMFDAFVKLLETTQAYVVAENKKLADHATLTETGAAPQPSTIPTGQDKADDEPKS